ncbi:MAG: transcriptional regulator PpsR [Tagaea sp. CACIAM 22H2]|nr:transcriptional regulator PpsR [Tagaea sp. CACIAM 22H2]
MKRADPKESRRMFEFATPTKTFEGLSAATAARLVSAACDMVLSIDGRDIVRDVSIRPPGLGEQFGQPEKWIGKRLSDLVTSESRAKIAIMLREAADGLEPKWRHVNYPTRKGADIPIQHAAVALPESGRTLVFGRDLRGVSALQQRLTDAQFAMERDLSRVRKTETRYRLLFQNSPNAILILEQPSGKVAEANLAAQGLLGAALKRGISRGFVDLLSAGGRKNFESAVARMRATGREQIAAVEMAGDKGALNVTISTVGDAPDAPLFVAIAKAANGAGTANGRNGAIEPSADSPDGLVVAHTDGNLIQANPAFMQFAQVSSAEVATGHPLERWIGRDGVDCDVLLANLRQRGHVRNFATVLRGDKGMLTDVEINGVLQGRGKDARIVLAVRSVEGRIAPPGAAGSGSRSPEQLVELIGRVSLKDLVRESTDAIEKMCIEAALELTGDNRASAAEMLGLSRQSLYVKLRRYALDDPSDVEND